MGKQNKKAAISEKDMMQFLDLCYEKCLDGIPMVSVGVEEMAEEYLQRYATKKKACKAMQKNQIIKCTTSGFLSSLGGVITMPVTLPANLTRVLYVQMRMIACTAYMAGFDLRSDVTQTFVYACLAGIAVNGLAKRMGMQLGVKMTNALIQKIPAKVLTGINQKVGFRLVTKFGTKGAVNLGKTIPVFGGVIGGGLDYAETKVIAARAYRWFFRQDFSNKGEEKGQLMEVDLTELGEEAAAF